MAQQMLRKPGKKLHGTPGGIERERNMRRNATGTVRAQDARRSARVSPPRRTSVSWGPSRRSACRSSPAHPRSANSRNATTHAPQLHKHINSTLPSRPTPQPFTSLCVPFDCPPKFQSDKTCESAARSLRHPRLPQKKPPNTGCLDMRSNKSL